MQLDRNGLFGTCWKCLRWNRHIVISGWEGFRHRCFRCFGYSFLLPHPCLIADLDNNCLDNEVSSESLLWWLLFWGLYIHGNYLIDSSNWRFWIDDRWFIKNTVVWVICLELLCWVNKFFVQGISMTSLEKILLILSHSGLAWFLNKKVERFGCGCVFCLGILLLFWDSFAANHVTAAAWFEAKPSYKALVWGKVGSWPICL